MIKMLIEKAGYLFQKGNDDVMFSNKWYMYLCEAIEQHQLLQRIEFVIINNHMNQSNHNNMTLILAITSIREEIFYI